MTANERHARVTDLFLDAADLPPADRDARLAAEPDADVRREAAAMLAHHSGGTDGLLDHPALDRFDDAFDAPPDDGRVGQTVGPWRLTGVLGRGGMGVVYDATRDDASFQQHAALKVVRPEVGDDFRARFVHERAVLAGLEHEHVARLLDGGVDADGTPYLAMERVDGAPITEFADQRGLEVDARLALFLQVCEAVAYAHRNLVVHRDLKPSNVLVTTEGRVKLLDFGIAKLLASDGDDAADLLTRTHAALTPAYAAPEQIRREAVTTATDVYALGVMLYEFLAGVRPYSLSGTTAAEAERLVCETVPKPPSAVAAPARARALRGDLDVIVAKALAKEPARRYASAEALADDVQRHLDGLPVRARPATRRYRASRFVARHRSGVATALVALVALAVGVATVLRQDRAVRAEAARALAMNDFLTGLLGAADPTVDGQDVRVVDLLGRAAADLDSVFAGQPDVEATMRMTLGETYFQLGLYAEAEAQHLRALALRELLYGPRHPDVVRAQSELGFVWVQQDRLEPADSILTLALASAGTFRGENELHGSVLSGLGTVRWWQGDARAALDLYQQSVAAHESVDEPDEVMIAAGMGNVAAVLHDLGRDDEAVATMERVLAVYRRAYAPTNARIAMALRDLSSGYYGLRRYDDALRVNEEAIAIFRRAVDPNSPDLANTLSNHGPVLIKLGRYAEAEAAEREAMAIFARTVGTEHQSYGAALLKASQAQELQGHVAEAEAGMRRAIAIFRATGPEDHPAMGHSQLALGKLLAAEDRDREAEPVLRRAFAIRSGELAPNHPDRADIASRVGEVLGRLGQRAEAESLLVAGASVLRRTAGDERAAEAAARLAAFRATRPSPTVARR